MGRTERASAARHLRDAEGGWLFKLGALDFAGGTVVHVTAGVSALVCALVIGKRLKYPHERPVPHNLTMTLTGAGLLWFGWFGFNSGSALSGFRLGRARVSYHSRRCRRRGAGLVVHRVVASQEAHALGVASGLVAGLVAITPAAGYGGVLAKYKYRYDDSLDAFGVGGLVGALLTDEREGLDTTQHGEDAYAG